MIAGDHVSLAASGEGDGEGSKSCGGRDSQLTAVLLTAVPFGAGATAALLLGASSEARDERRLHVGLPLLLGGVVFGLMPLVVQVSQVSA
jgi:hypothetical protein